MSTTIEDFGWLKGKYYSWTPKGMPEVRIICKIMDVRQTFGRLMVLLKPPLGQGDFWVNYKKDRISEEKQNAKSK